MSRLFFRKLLVILPLVALFCLVVLLREKSLFMLGLLALCFGLRHGLDADHILAIDNVTRNLQADNQNAYTTGTFFALGHSTIVFLLTLGIVCGINSIHAHFAGLQKMGDVTGAVISAVFLWITAGMNIYALSSTASKHTPFTPKGFLSSLLKPVFRSVDKPWKMYFVGFLFGLGFDTATEVGLLSISASSALQGFHASLILFLPILFSAGIVFTDSCDALFMSALYCSTLVRTHQLQSYYKTIVIIATLLAVIVGFSELIGISSWQLHNNIFIQMNNHFGWLGGSIMIFFAALFLFLRRKSFT